jgi:IS1 family transposase
MAAAACWVVLGVLLVLAWLAAGRRSSPGAARVPRVLRPRDPDDCPDCRRRAAGATGQDPARPAPRPWREGKSRRGAPKRVATAGFACPNAACAYHRITDAAIHALVGDGMHGKTERIQTFRCQACGSTFSARRDTPLYRLKTPAARVGEVLTALAEGLDVSAAERVFGHRRATITTWLLRAGTHGAALHARWFHDLHLPHLQLDEIRTRLRRRAQVLWLWVALDPLSKTVPVLHLGARSQAAAHAVVHALRRQLAPGCLPAFTSDGLNLYFYALTAHFGQWVAGRRRQRRRWQVAAGLLYGQAKKTYRRRRLVRVTPTMRCGSRAALRQALTLLGLSGRLNTAFVERVNLTLRQGVAALTRRTWATAQRTQHLTCHLEWWRAYYHFVRPHRGLRVALVPPVARRGRGGARRYRQRTPAMAAGLTGRPWTARELLLLPLPRTAFVEG